MSTTVSNLLSQIAYMVQEEPTFLTPFWSIDELMKYVNEISKEFVLKTQIYKTADAIPSTSGGRIYEQNPYTSQIDRIAYSNIALDRTNKFALDHGNIRWRTLSGIPKGYHQDQLPIQQFEVDRAPNSAQVGSGYLALCTCVENHANVIGITTPCPTFQPVIFESYEYTFAAVGGAIPYTWTLISGSLPPGLTLNASSGTVSGTPTTEGTYPYTIQVSDSSDPPLTDQISCQDVVDAAETSFRPLSFSVFDTDPPVNPTHSRVLDGNFCLDDDAPIGQSTTFADCQIDSITSLANYAELFAYDFPEPDPMESLVSATIWVRAAYDRNGPSVPGSDPVAEILILNAYNVDWPHPSTPPFVSVLFSASAVDVPIADYSGTFSAAEFTAAFPGGAADIYARAQQYGSVNESFPSTVHLRWYDTWITYVYA